MGHNGAPNSSSTLSNRSTNRPQQWVTRVGHKRSTRGLSLRGSVYQFRVRVPADLRAIVGSTHVKRSLRTDSLSLAIRLSRKVAAETDATFEAKRLEIGLVVESRLLPSPSAPATVEKTIERRSERASAKTTGPTLSQVYDRYLADAIHVPMPVAVFVAREFLNMLAADRADYPAHRVGCKLFRLLNNSSKAFRDETPVDHDCDATIHQRAPAINDEAPRFR